MITHLQPSTALLLTSMHDKKKIALQLNNRIQEICLQTEK